MGNNVLFVDMTIPFLPVISAVAQHGFTPFLIGSFTDRVRQAGIRCHDLFEFAPDDLKEQTSEKMAEISAGLAEAVGADAVKEVFSSPFGDFWYHTGVDFFNRFLEVAAGEIEMTICFQALLKNNDLDLIVFRTEKMPFERAFIRLAARHGISTLHIDHAIRGWNINIAGEYGRWLDSDYISVFGKRAYDRVVDSGIDPGRVFITGSPYWDELYSERNQMDRNEACMRLQLDPDHPVILFCTGYAYANSPTYTIQYNALIEDHKAVLGALKELDPQSQLIVRHHPTELNDAHATDQEKRAAVRAYKTWLKQKGVNHTLISNDHKIESFKAADAAVIYRGSNVIVDSMILQCPVIALRSGGVFGPDDGILVAENLDDLPALLKDVIDYPIKREKIIEAQNRALPDLNRNNDGKARERLADLIVRLAEKSPAHKTNKSRPSCLREQKGLETVAGTTDEVREILASGLIPTRRAVIDINRPCNAGCVMCYHAYDHENWSKSIDEVKQELTHARQRGNTSVDFTGGEPTIYPQMAEAIACAESIGLHTCVITNGIALEKIKGVVGAGCREWLVSIHGYEEQQDKILGVKNAWDKINNTIAYLKSAGCSIRVNCTLTRHNYEDLPKLAEYYLDVVKPAMVNFINFNPHYKWGDQGQPEIYNRLNDVQIKTSEVVPYLKEALELLNERDLWANVRYFPFCMLKGFETHICNNPQVMFDPYEWDYGMAPKTVEIYQAYGRSLQERIGFKGDPCRQCGIIDVCGGVHKNYEKFHGNAELTPYREQGDYPYHFKTDVEADIIVPAFIPNENIQRLLSEISEKTVPPYNLIVISRRQSAAKNRNYGMERSKSPYVIMCDDDLKDLPFAWNRQLVNILKENRHLLAVSARLMNPDGTPGKNTANNYDLEPPLVEVDMIPTACSVFRKTDVRFDEKFIRAGWEDTDFFRQLGEKHEKPLAIANTVKVIHLNEEKENGGAGNVYNQHLFFEKWQENPPNMAAMSGDKDALSRAGEEYTKLETLISEGRHAEALVGLEELIGVCPDFAPGQNRLGLLRLDQGDLEQSVHHLRRAADLEPMNPEYQKDLADLYRLTPGKVEEAIKIYIKILAIHPTHIRTLLAMGHVCREVEKPDDAVYFFGRALEIEPWNMEARENLDELSA